MHTPMKTSLGRIWKKQVHFEFKRTQEEAHQRGGNHSYDWFI